MISPKRWNLAAGLIGHFDPELRQIVGLSLGVSLTASLLPSRSGRRWAQRWPSTGSGAGLR